MTDSNDSFVKANGSLHLVSQDGLPSDLQNYVPVARNGTGTAVALRKRKRTWNPKTWAAGVPDPDSDVVIMRSVDLEPESEKRDYDLGGRQGVAGTRSFMGNLYGEDPTAAVEGRNGVDKWHELRHREPVLYATYLALTLPILAADWSFVKDPKGEVPNDVVDWMNERFGFGGFTGMMLGGGQKFLSDAMKSLLYGVSPFEGVFWIATDGKFAVDLEWRHPRTIWKFNIENERLSTMEQRANKDGYLSIGAQSTFKIDADRMVIFTHDREGHNWWGKSIFRTAYRAATMKNEFWYDQSILIDRFGAGIPTATYTGDAWNNLTKQQQTDALNRLDTILEDLRNSERAYINTPPGVELGVFGGKMGEGPDIIKAIDRCDFEIQVAGLAQDLGLGRSERGVRAIGEHFGDLRGTSILAIADELADTFAGAPGPGLGVATKLLRSEFPGLKAEPRFIAEGIKDKAFRGILKDLAPLVASGLLTPDDDIEDAIRSAFDFGSMADTLRNRDRMSASRRRMNGGKGPRNLPTITAPENIPINDNPSGTLPIGQPSPGTTKGPGEGPV